MAEISAKLVKELRDRTGLGMMECKKALQEADGDIETAIDNLRKSGQAKAAKKAGNIAADGAIIIAQEGNKALLLEVNCCDLILYFRLGRVGKKWEEMGRDWI